MHGPIALMLVPTMFLMAASAPDSSATDLAVMGVRLGISPAEARQVLKAESQAIEEHAVPCPLPPAQGCRLIRAALPDGSMDILFQSSATGPLAVRITFTVKGRGERDRAMVLAAAIDHYGPPTLNGSAWCVPDQRERQCSDDAPSMVFNPLAGAAGQFILAAPAHGEP